MSRASWSLRAALLTILAAGLASAALDPSKPPQPLPPDAHVLKVQSFSTNQVNRDYDGQWEGICAASDGNVYFASSTHSPRSGAGFFKYDPRTGAVTVLTKDITAVCGEDPAKITAQGQIHSNVVEMDGWLYCTTHFANEWKGAPDLYPGSHLIGYELATGKFRDFGAVRFNCTGYSAIQVDPPRKRVFFYLTLWGRGTPGQGDGSHVYRLDVTTGKIKEMAKVGTDHSAAFCMVVDAKGGVWLTTERTQNTLFHIDGDTGKVQRWPEVTPRRSDLERETPAKDQKDRWWRWGRPIGDGDKAVFSPRNGGQLWLFDPSAAPDWGRAFQPVEPFVGPHDIGSAFAGGRVYYIQREGGRPGEKADDHHLMSVTINAMGKGEITDHGLIVDQDGRRPWRMQSLAADDQGRVYMVGDWYLNPGDKGTQRYNYPEGKFEDQLRGQFFAVADVSAHIGATESAKPAPPRLATTGGR